MKIMRWGVLVGLMLALGIVWAATEAPPQFYLGVTREVTLATLGKPDAKVPPDQDGKELWIYGKAMVTFIADKVVSWQGFNEVIPLRPPGLRPLQLGATREEVAYRLGFPPKARLYTALNIGAKPEGEEEWTYSVGTVVFQDSCVVGWRNVKTPAISLGEKAAEPKTAGLNASARDLIAALGSPPMLTCYVKSGNQYWVYAKDSFLLRGGRVIWQGSAQQQAPVEQPVIAENPAAAGPDGGQDTTQNQDNQGFTNEQEFATFRLAYQPVLDRMLQTNTQLANTPGFKAMQDCLNQRPWWAISAQADNDSEYAAGVDAIENAYHQYLDQRR